MMAVDSHSYSSAALKSPSSINPQNDDELRDHVPDLQHFQPKYGGNTTSNNGGGERVRGLYTFTAQKPEHLSFKKGDTLLIIKKKAGWYKALHETTQQQGYIPANYVQVIGNTQQHTRNSSGETTNQNQQEQSTNNTSYIPPLINPPPSSLHPYTVLALHSYTAQASNQLSFTKDELLSIVNVQGSWWRGWRQNDVEKVVGYVPSNYVKGYDVPIATTKLRGGHHHPEQEEEKKDVSSYIMNQSTLTSISLDSLLPTTRKDMKGEEHKNATNNVSPRQNHHAIVIKPQQQQQQQQQQSPSPSSQASNTRKIVVIPAGGSKQQQQYQPHPPHSPQNGHNNNNNNNSNNSSTTDKWQDFNFDDSDASCGSSLEGSRRTSLEKNKENETSGNGHLQQQQQQQQQPPQNSTGKHSRRIPSLSLNRRRSVSVDEQALGEDRDTETPPLPNVTDADSNGDMSGLGLDTMKSTRSKRSSGNSTNTNTMFPQLSPHSDHMNPNANYNEMMYNVTRSSSLIQSSRHLASVFDSVVAQNKGGNGVNQRQQHVRVNSTQQQQQQQHHHPHPPSHARSPSIPYHSRLDDFTHMPSSSRISVHSPSHSPHLQNQQNKWAHLRSGSNSTQQQQGEQQYNQHPHQHQLRGHDSSMQSSMESSSLAEHDPVSMRGMNSARVGDSSSSASSAAPTPPTAPRKVLSSSRPIHLRDPPNERSACTSGWSNFLALFSCSGQRISEETAPRGERVVRK